MRSIRSLRVFPAIVTVLAAISVGCMSRGPQPSTGVSTTPSYNAAAGRTMASPSVPAGASFHATLDGPISSQHANVGDGITATLTESLQSVDGAALVPKGAKLRGQILEVGREGINRLVIRFDTIEFGGRARAISATVKKVESARVVASASTDLQSPSVDVYPMLPRNPAPDMGMGMGGGPTSEPLPLEIEAGTGIELQLTKSLQPEFIRQ